MSMDGFRKAAVLLPIFADALPFLFMLIAPSWQGVPTLVVAICSFAPPLVGSGFLVGVGLLRYMKVVSSISNGLLIGIVFAIVGIIEPLFYWI